MGASGHIRLPSASFWVGLSSYMSSKFCRDKLKLKKKGGRGGKKMGKKGNFPLTILKIMLTNVLPQTKT